jgi:hypothetical protein
MSGAGFRINVERVSHYGEPEPLSGIISQTFFQKLRHFTDRYLLKPYFSFQAAAKPQGCDM